MLFNLKYYAPMHHGGGAIVLDTSNYEYYFLLFIDGELNELEQTVVVNFIEQNPNYQLEFDNLLATKLEVDALQIDKEILHKNTNITLANYETYLLLQLDNELTNEELEKLNVFLNSNPSLEKEWDSLQKTKLPQHDITSFNKSILHKTTLSTENNIASLLCSYIDNELNASKKIVVEKLLLENSTYQQELDLLLQTKLPHQKIVYAKKKELYRKEEKTTRVIPIWLRYAAAACLLFIIGFTGVNYFKKTGNKPKIELVSTNKNKTNSTAVPFTLNNTLDTNNTLQTTNTIATITAPSSTPNNNLLAMPNAVVNPKLRVKTNVTNNNLPRITNNNDVANKKVLTNNDFIVANTQEDNTLKMETNVKLQSETPLVKDVAKSNLQNLTTPVKTNTAIAFVDEKEEVSIANIDVNKIDQNGKVKKMKSKIGNYIQQKIKAVNNSSIAIGGYEIALAR